jgi:hypothetical protein
MTDIDFNRSVTRPVRAGVPLRLVRGLVGGCALGVFARLWMRLIAEDPAFTWNGTIFIVLGFTIFGFTQSISSLTGERCRRRWTATIGRVVGIAGLLPLFVGAGAIMMPTVVGGGLAAARSDWRRVLRTVCLLLAAAPIVIVGHDLIDTFGWSLKATSGIILLLAVYGTIVRMVRPTFSRRQGAWRIPRAIKAIVWTAVALATLFLTVGFVFR